VWFRVFETLSAMWPGSMSPIDRSIIGVHQHAAAKKGVPDRGIGRSRGGLSTKINAVVDENGRPVRLLLTAGQVHVLKAVPEFLAGLKCRHVIADRGYDADALLTRIRAAEPRPKPLRLASASSNDPSIDACIDDVISSSALLQTQARPTCRYPLRQAREELPRRRRSRFKSNLDQDL